MAVDLEALDAELNGATYTLLGDTITYTPSGGETLRFKAIVDYGDQVETLGSSKLMTGDCAVEVPISTIARPAGSDVITFPRRPGETFQPKHWLLDETGMNWLIALKKKPA